MSPKYIDKKYQCSLNHVDLFSRPSLICPDFLNLLKIILANIQLNFQKQTEVLFYLPVSKIYYTGKILPSAGKRFQIILLNKKPSISIPQIETTGQHRFLVDQTKNGND